MFGSLKSKVALGVYVLLLISVPVGAYLASQNQSPITRAREVKKSSPLPSIAPKTNGSALDELKQLTSPSSNPNASSDPLNASGSGNISFGHTLFFLCSGFWHFAPRLDLVGHQLS